MEAKKMISNRVNAAVLLKKVTGNFIKILLCSETKKMRGT
jgi:hypothetical protein